MFVEEGSVFAMQKEKGIFAKTCLFKLVWSVLIKMSSFVFKGKMVIVGDIAVGKTSLASRFVDDKFTQNHLSSVGGTLQELHSYHSCLFYKDVGG